MSLDAPWMWGLVVAVIAGLALGLRTLMGRKVKTTTLAPGMVLCLGVLGGLLVLRAWDIVRYRLESPAGNEYLTYHTLFGFWVAVASVAVILVGGLLAIRHPAAAGLRPWNAAPGLARVRTAVNPYWVRAKASRYWNRRSSGAALTFAGLLVVATASFLSEAAGTGMRRVVELLLGVLALLVGSYLLGHSTQKS
ncbi:MAG: hypothetical protein ABR600_11820 [Actinomycetota bacterium]